MPQSRNEDLPIQQLPSSQYQTCPETVSTFDKKFVLAETIPTKQIGATYLRLGIEDLTLILEAVHNNTDSLRLFFGCKALRKVIASGSETAIKQVMSACPALAKRLIYLLMMP